MDHSQNLNQQIKLYYVTHFARFLSTDADAICVTKTCEALSKAGLEIELIVPNKDIPQKDVIEEEIFRFYGIQKPYKIQILDAINLYKFGIIGRTLYKFNSILRNNKKHTAIFYTRHLETALVATLSGRKTILDYHDLSFVEENIGLKLLIYLSNKRPVRFISVTKAGAARLEARGVNKDHILVAPNGVSLEKYSPQTSNSDPLELKRKYNIPNNKPLVLFSGNLYLGRGIMETIDSAHKNPKIHFLIIGGTNMDIERCKNHVKGNNVQFLGFILPQDLPELLCIADILIMPYTTRTPTWQDMSPMKMFDYLAVGKPIIATDFPVIREILQDKINAVLIPPNSADTISHGIQWILDHPNQAKQIGHQAKLDAEKYTWSKRGQKIVSWIQEQFSDNLK